MCEYWTTAYRKRLFHIWTFTTNTRSCEYEYSRYEHRASMTTCAPFTAYICTCCSKLLLLCWWIRTSSYYVLLLWRLGISLYSCKITSLLTHLAAPPRLRFAKDTSSVSLHQGQIHFLLPSWAVVSASDTERNGVCLYIAVQWLREAPASNLVTHTHTLQFLQSDTATAFRPFKTNNIN